MQPSEEPLDPFDTSLEGRKKLIVDPGPKSIARYLERDAVPVPLVGKFQGSLPNASDAVNVTLGELRTDDVGRLVFIGGSGVARSVQGTGAATKLVQPEIVTNFDNFDWIDSICDGWVDVQVEHAGRPDLALECVLRHRLYPDLGTEHLIIGFQTRRRLPFSARRLNSRGASNTPSRSTISWRTSTTRRCPTSSTAAPISTRTYGRCSLARTGWLG